MADLRRSLVINFFSSSGAAFLQFIVSVLLARILSPSEIGVYSMTVVFVNFAHVFRDFGVTSYLQREHDLTPEKIRSAIGVVFSTSWLIAVMLFLASGWIGRWFNEPEIVPVMRVLSIGFLFIPFGAITNALLTREFAAEKQAIVNAVGTISFCVSCLVFGYLGYGSMSLAYANLVNITRLRARLHSPASERRALAARPSTTGAAWPTSASARCCRTAPCALNNAIPDILLGKLGSARHGRPAQPRQLDGDDFYLCRRLDRQLWRGILSGAGLPPRRIAGAGHVARHRPADRRRLDRAGR